MAHNNGNQARAWEMQQQGASYQQIADALGCKRSTVKSHIAAARKQYNKGKQAPIDNPHGLSTKSTCVLYKTDEAGNVVFDREWRKMEPALDAINQVVEGLCAKVEGVGKVRKRKPKKTDCDNTLFEIDIFDPHVGMYADERQTLESDYDCDMAAKRMVVAAESLASRASRPKKVVVCFGGDVMHMDTRDFRTSSTQSNHVLDVDTRYQRVVRYVVASCTDVIQIAASIGSEVEIVITPGNHDWHSCVWLTSVLSAFYSRCEHVSVLMQDSDRKAITWGDNLLIWTHGDKIAPQKWPAIIAAEWAQLWGLTKHRYLKMGHVHHQKTIAPVVVNEQAGLVVEYLAALCPADTWHASAGFVGTQRGASAFEYHKKHGLQTRFYHNC
tara:strand:+ start:20546 stop:21697 length:1152 start_codon:yes stop_codon:yes gene_type:complete